MRHFLKIVSVSVGAVFGCLIFHARAEEPEALIPPPPIISKDRMESGVWQFTETKLTGDRQSTSTWEVELIDYGMQTIIALGERLDINGMKLKYKSEAIFVFDRHYNGDLTGLYFEVDQNGQQILMPMKIDISNLGKSMTISAANEDRDVKSTFSGKWLKKEDDYEPLKKGKWTVRETVSPDQGGYNIVWGYELNEVKSGIYGSGRKTFINGKRAHPYEKDTVCSVFLKRSEVRPDIIKGTGTEKSPHAKTFYAAYDGWVSPSGERFVMFSFENKELTAIFVGEFDE